MKYNYFLILTKLYAQLNTCNSFKLGRRLEAFERIFRIKRATAPVCPYSRLFYILAKQFFLFFLDLWSVPLDEFFHNICCCY